VAARLARVTGQPEGPHIAGKYKLGRLLGRGGMGSVYAGEHVVTGRAVAIKHMARELAVREDARRRFVREAQAVGRLEHPNVVEVLDAGVDEADGVPYVVQSLLRGATLRAYMTRHPQPGSVVAVGLVLPILRALAAAHEAGLVHRDVKPSNVFLAQVADLGGDRVIPKLLDFGISKFTDTNPEEATLLTETGAAVGTAAYMSPEQASAERDVDGRADVWAVGVMLYELLAGERPFEAPSPALLLLKVVSQEPPRLESRAVALRPEIADIAHRALSRDRDARWPSARAFHDALAAAIGASTREPWAVAPGIEAVTAAVEAEVAAGLFSMPGSPSKPLVSTVGERPSSRQTPPQRSAEQPLAGNRARVAIAVGLVALVLGFAGTWLVTRDAADARARTETEAASTPRSDATAPPRTSRREDAAPARATPPTALPTATTTPASPPVPATAVPAPSPAVPTSAPVPREATPRTPARRPPRPPTTSPESPRVGTRGAPILSAD
jgi:serine/threonine protein kinase